MIIKNKNIVFLIYLCLFSFAYSQEIGLVLSGGGAKGAYEVGAYKALIDYGIAQKVTVISGTSVGGLNAALFTCVPISEAERIWKEEVPYKLVNDKNIRSWFVSQAGIKEIIESIPLEKLYDGMPKIIVNAVRSRLGFVKVITSKIGIDYSYIFYLDDANMGEIKNRLLATSAIPFLCDPIRLEDDEGGHLYMDGGVAGNNVPIEPLVESFPDINNIFVVYLKTQGLFQEEILYENKNVYEIFPSDEISPYLDWIDFSQSNIERLIEAGYSETSAYLQNMGYFPVSSYWFE
jgi:NTE family protein